MERTFNDEQYQGLLQAIHSAYGYDFSDYAEPSVKRRITHFLEDRRIDMEQLTSLLLEDEAVFVDFLQHLSITVTEMFRNPSFYRAIRELMNGRLATYPVLKIWLAGCATGQEAYSVAILLKETGLLERSIIYATDINQQSLQTAKLGIYSLDGMKSSTQNYLSSGGQSEFSLHYKAQHNSVLFDRSLTQNVVFAPHNLATDQSFNEFQLILCRNVIMYFNRQLQNKVIDLFYESLCPFGFLGLGDRESLLFADKRGLFEEINRKEKIFRKIK